MNEELIYIADKIENIKCKTHAEVAKIEIVDARIQINCCCERHKQFLERHLEYEIYNLLFKEDEAKTEAMPSLKYAV